ncbi:MAG: CRTAC1 family protein [Verrucomicrobiota bacterium]|nr:CRTAC1 family protein [Verrucomicrobiota bacterium]
MTKILPRKTQLIWVTLTLAITSLFGADPIFEDATKSLNLSIREGQAAWGDFNNDGWEDLHNGELWINELGKKFSQFTEKGPSGHGIWGDYNNDGWLDFYSWSNGKLYRNESGKYFVDATPKALAERPMKVSRGAAWMDMDNDGYLDLYVAGYEIWQKAVYADALFRNVGGKDFVAHALPKARNMSARGVSAADFDSDGDVDVYVSNYRLFPNRLWSNDGGGKFTEIANLSGTAGDGGLGAWGHTIGSAWGDLDNDGYLDLFVGNFSHPPAYQDRPKFLRNRGPDGKFAFEDKSSGAGLHWQESYASPALADYDNDGHLDLFFTTVYAGNTSVLYRNSGNWKFTNTTGPSGIRTAQTYQASWCDFDKDGDLDLTSGGKLWRNRGNSNKWLAVQLKGAGKVNHAAIGTTVRLEMGEQTLTRHVNSSTGEGSQNSLTLHFGLGANPPKKLEVTVLWPGDSQQKQFVEPDKFNLIKKQ